MKAFYFIIVFCLSTTLARSQASYAPEWESLDKRPTPAWFKDAKFGIFIHWGIYSVPMWSPKGTYEEWYQYWLEKKTLLGNGNFTGTEVYDYHVKTYGEEFIYADFAPMFKASDYHPEEWADLFQKAGARYVVLTTKHHDGFALWPSKEASRDYGRPWNSMEIGAKRDLVGEYVEALRKTDIKVGCYISLREWNNPLYHPETMDLYVDRHFFPQLKDLVNRYKPDLIWADGPDPMNDKTWKVERTLAWLYSESPVKDSVVVNDRWANNTGQKHGDYFTREYSSTNQSYNKPWEECRGMGFSFAYNQNEDLEDYATPQSLILTLVNVVSQGGNLLLGIGPNGNGKIPPIMQERLLQMGEWLKVNGEAIYGTHKWRQTNQWSAGNQKWKSKDQFYVGANAILKQTVDPDPGYAVKEVFFTAKDENMLYAILPRFPKGNFTLKGIQINKHTKITLLGLDRKLDWKQQGTDLVVSFPVIPADEMPCDYAWTLRLENIN